MTVRALLVGADICVEALASMLGDGFAVVALRDADAAVRLRGHDADVVLLALGRDPQQDLDRMAALREPAYLSGTPILALVPRDLPEYLVRAFDLGVSDCAGLPLDAGELRARMTALLRRKRANDLLSAQARDTLRLAHTDAVTGLYNRHYFNLMLDAGVVRARARATPLAVMMIDVDLFKSLNDRFGHAAGDRALQAIARQIGANVRGSDIVVRFGGDELVVLMPDTDLATAQRIAERLRQAVGETKFDTGPDFDVATLLLTVSIGVAALCGHDTDGMALIARADAALFTAKRAGRNRVVTADSAAA